MKTFLIVMTALACASKAEARQFLKTFFRVDARYEDMSGTKYSSSTAGTIRVSDDRRFCAIDLPQLSSTFECKVINQYAIPGLAFGVQISEENASAMMHQLVRKVSPWPSPILPRVDVLIGHLRSIRLGYLNGNTFYSSADIQLDDKTQVDALHASFGQGTDWVPY